MQETAETREEALRQPVFRKLYLGALQIEDPKRRLSACYIILLGGRLGLRLSEIIHVRSAWIDWTRGELCIPEHDPCGCEICWESAKGKFDHLEKKEKDEEDFENPYNSALEVLYDQNWSPKSDHGARRIPFGYSPRLTAVIMIFQSQYSALNVSDQAVRDLVKEAAENADGVDPDEVTVRGLRGTAATYFATLLYRPKNLKSIMGWSRIETARKYLRRASGYVSQLLYELFGDGENAPPIFPREPEKTYPLVADPQPYKGEWWNPYQYDKATRMARAERLAEEPLRLHHPRKSNVPKDIKYDPAKHELTGAVDPDGEFVKEVDGKKMITKPTLWEYCQDHEFERAPDVEAEDCRREPEDYEFFDPSPPTRQVTFDESDLGWSESDESESPAVSALPAVCETVATLIDRLDRWVVRSCHSMFGCRPLDPFGKTRARRYATGIVFISILLATVVITGVTSGLYDPSTMTVTASRSHRLALAMALVFSLYGISREPFPHRQVT